MNKELVTKDSQKTKVTKINQEIISMWRPITDLNMIINNLRSIGAHAVANKIALEVATLEKVQADCISKFLGIH
jgi:hypothetical protein